METRVLTIELPKGISLEDAKSALINLKFKIIEQSDIIIENDKISKSQEKEIIQISKSINKNGAKKWFAKKGIEI